MRKRYPSGSRRLTTIVLLIFTAAKDSVLVIFFISRPDQQGITDSKYYPKLGQCVKNTLSGHSPLTSSGHTSYPFRLGRRFGYCLSPDQGESSV